jgi:hypothetical protein
MSTSTPTTRSGSSLGKRALAVLVLLVAAWLLLKVVIGFVTAIATTLAVVVAVIAVIWAIRIL